MNSFILYSSTPTTGRLGKLILFNKSTSRLSLIKPRLLSTSDSNRQQQQHNEGKSPKKGSGGFKFFALAVTGFAVGIGYATLNPDARKQVESYVPQSHYLFDYVDGFIQINKNLPGEWKKSIEGVWKTSEKEKTDEAKKPASLSPIVGASKSQSTSTVTASLPSSEKTTTKTPAPAAKAPSAAAEPAPAKAKAEPKQDLDWKKTLKEHGLEEEATVNAIENRLSFLNDNMKLKVSEALNSSYVAIESLNKYKAALKVALDDTKQTTDDQTKELQWKQVTSLFDVQTNHVNQANQKFATAKAQVDELDKLLAEVKQDELSKNVKNLKEAQLELIKQFRLLQAEQNKLTEAINHANVLKSYTNEQKLAKTQFLKEMQALQPEGIHGINKSQYGDQLTNDELNSLLIHAHKRVLQLQKQIEKVQLEQNQKLHSALEDQQRKNEELLKTIEANLYLLHRKEFELEVEKIIEDQKLLGKDELKKELSRQAAAHNNHLTQMLKMQGDELASIYEKKLIYDHERIRDEFNSKVSESVGRLKGIEHALNARANLELQANNAKQLWLAVQSLHEIINSKAEDLDPSSSLVNIQSSVKKINDSAPDNEFIQKILKSIPSDALESGLWSEPDLKDRFHRLRKTCERVALIDERGGTLFKYFISYLQSFFIFRTRIDRAKLEQTAEANLNDLPINLNDTFSLLDHAEYFIDSGNVEYALRLMQQLKGEPNRLARDWIKDAIRLIEIKQACLLINAYISSVYIGTNFK